ncbi:MAG: hypothetical protein M1840_008584 [Geoglossum simile]|nr:MAG: hypothetical protein M1840_008584 [Geoglossum simile]
MLHVSGEFGFSNPAEEAYFMVISSGTRNEGPHLLLYTSSDPKLESWQHLGVLLSVKKQAKWNNLLPDFGVNFECGSFCSLKAADGTVRDYVIVGVEGGEPERALLTSTNTYRKHSGRLDHGIFYSACIFRGPSNRDDDGDLIVWGWANEDDSGRDLSDQGWAGSLTLPRELFVLTAGIPPGEREIPTGWIRCSGFDGTMYTLGTRPARQLEGLRKNAELFENKDLELLRSRSFEISGRFLLRDDIQRLGFKVRMSEGPISSTTVSAWELLTLLQTREKARL